MDIIHHAHARTLSGPAAAGFLSFEEPTQAARILVVRENGVRVQFGELWRLQRTVVIFIFLGVDRMSYRCPMCQDYLASVMCDVDHAELMRSGIRLIVIGGSPSGLIRSYRHLPHSLRTFSRHTPGQRLYCVLSMGRISSGSQKSHCPTDHAVGSYVRHGAVNGLAMVDAHALRIGIPVWKRGGDASQLGGEFVLGPGMLSCTYAHRMPTTASHAPIVDILAVAGVRSARRDCGASPGTASDTGANATEC
ncbi:hypothetical protein BC826DRAFT_921304 [Russula brevipes]|nr:hypothetical protein BC826DRAFT_921304 [Russula brevipes]